MSNLSMLHYVQPDVIWHVDVDYYAWNLEITGKRRYIYRAIRNAHENRSFQQGQQSKSLLYT